MQSVLQDNLLQLKTINITCNCTSGEYDRCSDTLQSVIINSYSSLDRDNSFYPLTKFLNLANCMNGTWCRLGEGRSGEDIIKQTRGIDVVYGGPYPIAGEGRRQGGRAGATFTGAMGCLRLPAGMPRA